MGLMIIPVIPFPILTGLGQEIKPPHRAVYNLTVRDIILPYKNLTGDRQRKGVLGTLASFLKEARVWTFIVGGN
jgi:hypothetical protein